MDVIGAGFGRTGTLSLKGALEHLGFGPCMHMVSLFDDAERATLFQRAADGDAASLAKAFEDYRSTVDWPGTYFWRALVRQYPQARVILTTRDPEQWYDSAHQTIFQSSLNPPTEADGVPAATITGIGMVGQLVWDGTFGGRFADREHAIRVFEEHNAAVRREIPADRLLEFQVTEGWQPLCGFLGRPVPDEPFPRTNDSAAFQARLAERKGAHRP